jgi:hypothetical protein
LDTKTLHQLCGIADTPPVPREEWLSAELKFIGGDGYALGTRHTQVKLKSNAEGFCLATNGEWSIAGSSLLGSKVRHGRLYDVEVLVEGLVTLSLANLCPGRYPIVLRNEEVVRLN